MPSTCAHRSKEHSELQARQNSCSRGQGERKGRTDKGKVEREKRYGRGGSKTLVSEVRKERKGEETPHHLLFAEGFVSVDLRS